MNVREKLIDLIIDTKRTDPETGSFTEYLADHLIAHGVTVQEWIPVTERLPGREGKLEPWKAYNVVVLRSHWPTSSYDLCDAPYDEKIVTTASIFFASSRPNTV